MLRRIMFYKYLKTLVCLLPLLSQASFAEIKLGDKGSLGTISFNAGYNSSYIWRGIDQNSGSGAPYIGADLSTPLGIYFGTWTSAASGTNYSQEVDIYAGIKKSLGPVTVDLGIIEYRYPGAIQRTHATNFTEGYVKLTLAPDKSPFTIGAAYYEDDTEGAKSGNNSANRHYREVNATFDAGMFQTFISYGQYTNNTDVTTLTISKSLFDLGFSLSYIDAETQSKTSGLAPAKDRAFTVLNISKTF